MFSDEASNSRHDLRVLTLGRAYCSKEKFVGVKTHHKDGGMLGVVGSLEKAVVGNQ